MRLPPAEPYARQSGWRRDENRYPLEPLTRFCGGPAKLQNITGCSGSDLAKATRDGLTDRQADNWAIHAGTHPALIWDTWIIDGLAVVDLPLLDEGTAA